MKKHFGVLQPPLVDKYSFLVNDISQSGSWGITTDFYLFEYNMNLISANFNLDRKVQLLLNQNGITEVIPLGRFITIIKRRADDNEGSMTFFDFEIEFSRKEIQEILEISKYSDNIICECFKVYDYLKLSFSSEFDEVLLLKSPDFI